jgi:hypothetical protein
MKHVRLASACLFTLAACASSTGGPTVTSTQQNETFISGASQYDVSSKEEKDVMEQPILAPLDSAWRALPGVFLELDIEPGTVDQKNHVISNTSFVVRRTIGGVSLSRYVNCGTSISGPMANQLKVTLSLVVQVVATDSSAVSKLRSQLDGWGVDEGVSSSRIHCGSTGQLEQRIARMVNDDISHRTKKAVP